MMINTTGIAGKSYFWLGEKRLPRLLFQTGTPQEIKIIVILVKGKSQLNQHDTGPRDDGNNSAENYRAGLALGSR